MNKDELIEYVSEEYDISPEYLWESTPDAFVFRRKNNRKWFAVAMEISKSKLGIDSDEKVYILDVKCDPLMLGSYLEQTGFFRAYHMNKEKWLTVLLDGSVDREDIIPVLELSYELADNKKKKRT